MVRENELVVFYDRVFRIVAVCGILRFSESNECLIMDEPICVNNYRIALETLNHVDE